MADHGAASGTAVDIETSFALERLVEAKGIKLTKRGSKLVGRCPFGEHDADALTIDPKANTWTCTVGCGDGGVVDWVARTEGISPSHAEALLRADFQPTGSVENVKTSTTTKLPDLIRPDESDATVRRKVLGFYHRALVGSPEAMEWLRDRGIRDPEVITHFKLGLCDRTLGYRLQKRNRKAGKQVRGQLRRLGILRKSGHEHFRGSLVVPFFDEDNHIVNLYGYKLGGTNLRSGTAIETWLTDEPVGVLNPEGFVEGQKLILAGTLLDALTWWSWGFRFVSTTLWSGHAPRGREGPLGGKEHPVACPRPAPRRHRHRDHRRRVEGHGHRGPSGRSPQGPNGQRHRPHRRRPEGRPAQAPAGCELGVGTSVLPTSHDAATARSRARTARLRRPSTHHRAWRSPLAGPGARQAHQPRQPSGQPARVEG
ncbi:MAG TPA: hypothetical protein ENK19_10455 [Acidobacteria bacterium]|nr:hypothetical protein [Acidobacteriota bacterium]